MSHTYNTDITIQTQTYETDLQIGGREIELQANDTHLQWRYVGVATWTDLISLEEIASADLGLFQPYHVLAGPASGVDAAVGTKRSLVSDDIPNIDTGTFN